MLNLLDKIKNSKDRKNIQTMLKVGSKRYDFEGWCVEMLDILPSEGFPKAYFDRDER